MNLDVERPLSRELIGWFGSRLGFSSRPTTVRNVAHSGRLHENNLLPDLLPNRPKAEIYPTSRSLFEIHGFDIVI